VQGGFVRSDSTSQRQAQSDLRIHAQKSLARGDFQSARHAAELFKENGGNPAELVAKIDREEQRELKQLENQFDQLKQRGDDNAVQQLKALLPRFQALADDGGPQSREALSYAKNIPRAIADVRARASQKSAGSRCEALNERVQLGEALSEEERTFLKESCQ
jgi:hypothetical protein